MSLRSYIDKFKQSDSFLKYVSIVAGGTVIAQGFNMALMPILSRIYSPEDFGILSVFSSVISILIPVSSLRYYLAIALPKSEKQSQALIALTFLIQTFFLIIFTIIILLAGDTLLTHIGIKRLIPYKLLLPIAVFGASIYASLVQWSIREKLFGIIARTKISQSFSGGIVKIIFGLLGFKPFGLLLGTVIGQAGGITSLIQALRSKFGFHKTCLIDIRRSAIKYRRFPIYDTPASLINIISDQIIPILIFSYFGAQITGFFSISQQLLIVPSLFIGDAIGQVFLQKASVAKYNNTLRELSITTYSFLLQLGFFPTLVIACFAPSIFNYVLGNSWNEAGCYTIALTPTLALNFAFNPISCLFNVQNKQNISLKLEILNFTSKITAFYIGVFYSTPLTTIAIFSSACAIILLIRTFFALSICNCSTVVIISKILRIICIYSFYIPIIILYNKYNSFLLIILATIIYSVIYIYQIYERFLALKAIS